MIRTDSQFDCALDVTIFGMQKKSVDRVGLELEGFVKNKSIERKLQLQFADLRVLSEVSAFALSKSVKSVITEQRSWLTKAYDCTFTGGQFDVRLVEDYLIEHDLLSTV